MVRKILFSSPGLGSSFLTAFWTFESGDFLNPFLYWLKMRSAGLSLLLVVFYACLRHDLIFSRIGRALDARSDVPASNEIGVILLGDFVGRGEAAAEEVRAGRLKRLVWGRTEAGKAERLGYVGNEADYVELLLLKNGVPARALTKLDQCTNGSTIDEARCTYNWFRDHPPFPARLTIVTSWFHTRRARWIFRKIWKETGTEFDVVGAFDPEKPPDLWWHDEEQGFSVIIEYIKWAYYLTHYR